MILKCSWGWEPLFYASTYYIQCSFHCTSLIPSVDCELSEGIFFIAVSLMPTVEAPGVAKWILYYLTHWQWFFCPGWAPVSTSGFDASYFLTPCPLSEQLAAPASCLPPGFVQQWGVGFADCSPMTPLSSPPAPFYSKGGRKRKSRWQCYPWSPLIWVPGSWLSTPGQRAARSAPKALGQGQKVCVLGPALPLTALGVQYPFSDLNYSSMIGWGRLAKESSTFAIIMQFIWNYHPSNPPTLTKTQEASMPRQRAQDTAKNKGEMPFAQVLLQNCSLSISIVINLPSFENFSNLLSPTLVSQTSAKLFTNV